MRREVADVLPMLLLIMVRACPMPPSRLLQPATSMHVQPSGMGLLALGFVCQPASCRGSAVLPDPPCHPARLTCRLQPLDALGTVLEGGILGASDTG